MSESPSPPLKNGWIVRFRYPGTDFDKALEAGFEHAMEHFAGMIGGLRVGHVEELRRLLRQIIHANSLSEMGLDGIEK